MNLPDDVLFIIDTMNSHGYSAHVVGGSVRDYLIGRELGDFDITTNALPEETKRVFSEYRTVDTGIKHGTVTLVLNGTPYEITTYRVDGDYLDNRHPESVSFTTSLADDLVRRDFTVNAMAYDPYGGLVDLFGGREDLKFGVIRAVGDPYKRFDEDALRILRALRFASVLGFDVDTDTLKAARALCGRLSAISKERIYTELKKLIAGKDASRILIDYADVLEIAFEGVRVKRLPCKALFNEADYLTRLLVIFYLNSENATECAERTLTALKTDKLTRTHTVAVLSAYEGVSLTSESMALGALADHGEAVVRGVLALGILLGRFTDREALCLDAAIESKRPYMISQLALRGSDLVAAGIRGERVGAALRELLYATVDGKVENEHGALLSYILKQNSKA